MRQMAYLFDQRVKELEGEEFKEVLKGKQISNAAYIVLRAHNAPLNYRTILRLVEKHTEKRVYGEKPEATLLSAIHRDKRIIMVRPRSGLFTVKE